MRGFSGILVMGRSGAAVEGCIEVYTGDALFTRFANVLFDYPRVPVNYSRGI